LGDLHRFTRPRIFSRGAPGDPPMAVPSRHLARLNWSLRRHLVPTRSGNRTHEAARTIHRFTATFCWALYGVLIKRPSMLLGPTRSFGLVSLITSILLLPLTFAFGNISAPLHAGTQVNLVLIISAVTCITLAHVLYYVAIREIGVALAQ